METEYGGDYRKKSFKERWLEKDIFCPHCNNVTKQAKGLNKQNLMKLLRVPTFNDFLMLFIIGMLLVVSWAYNRDISICREYIKEQQGRQLDTSIFDKPGQNWQNFNITDPAAINNNYGENYSNVEKPEEDNQTANQTASIAV